MAEQTLSNFQLVSQTVQKTCSECEKDVADEQCDEHPGVPVKLKLNALAQLCLLKIQLNPLKFFAADRYLEQWPKPGSTEIYGPPSYEEIVGYLCGNASADPDKIARRYKDSLAANLQIVPLDSFFLDKLIDPLKQAHATEPL